MLDFLRELSVSFSGDAKVIVKSGSGVIGLKISALFERVFGVCDGEKEAVEVAMSFTGLCKNLSW